MQTLSPQLMVGEIGILLALNALCVPFCSMLASIGVDSMLFHSVWELNVNMFLWCCYGGLNGDFSCLRDLKCKLWIFLLRNFYMIMVMQIVCYDELKLLIGYFLIFTCEFHI